MRSIHDENVAGVYDGWFASAVMFNRPLPEFGWDPAVAYRGLHRVARFGHLELRRGRQVLPMARADSMVGVVMDYIYKEHGDDWPLVAKRLAEVVAVIPYHMGAGVELGNAYQRMGERIQARDAFQSLIDQGGERIDALTRGQLQAQVALLDSGKPMATLPLLRNPWME